MELDKRQDELKPNSRASPREEASSNSQEKGEVSSSLEEFFEDVIFSREGEDKVKSSNDADRDFQDIYDFSDASFDIIEPKCCSLLNLQVPRPPYFNPYAREFNHAYESSSSTPSTDGPIPPLMSLTVVPPFEYYRPYKPSFIKGSTRYASIISPRRSSSSTHGRRHKDRRLSSRDQPRSTVSHRRR